MEFFYGTTIRGGANNADDGVLYSLSMGLGPFIETQQPAARTGARVAILGNNFERDDERQLQWGCGRIRCGFEHGDRCDRSSRATTGFVSATTPGGVLTSNRGFYGSALARL